MTGPREEQNAFASNYINDKCWQRRPNGKWSDILHIFTKH